MSRELKNVLIIGAGGNLGPHVFSALDSNPSFTVSVLSREGSKSTFPSHIKVFTTTESYPESALLTAFKGQDAIVDLAPMDAVDQHKRCIDIAIKAGVKRYIPSEFGSNSELPELAAAVPILESKGVIRRYLKSKEGEGLTWTGVINGPFFDWGLSLGFLGFDLEKKTALIYGDGNNYMDTTVLPTIGKSVAGVLQHPEETANRCVHINSYHTTQNQILTALEKVTGEKWTVQKANLEEEAKKGKEMLLKGEFAGFIPALCAFEYSGADYKDFAKFGLWNEKLGLPKTNEGMDDTVKKVVEKGKINMTSRHD